MAAAPLASAHAGLRLPLHVVHRAGAVADARARLGEGRAGAEADGARRRRVEVAVEGRDLARAAGVGVRGRAASSASRRSAGARPARTAAATPAIVPLAVEPSPAGAPASDPARNSPPSSVAPLGPHRGSEPGLVTLEARRAARERGELTGRGARTGDHHPGSREGARAAVGEPGGDLAHPRVRPAPRGRRRWRRTAQAARARAPAEHDDVLDALAQRAARRASSASSPSSTTTGSSRRTSPCLEGAHQTERRDDAVELVAREGAPGDVRAGREDDLVGVEAFGAAPAARHGQRPPGEQPPDERVGHEGRLGGGGAQARDLGDRGGVAAERRRQPGPVRVVRRGAQRTV